MTVHFRTDGTATAFYDEELGLTELGEVSLERVSTVEWNKLFQCWEVWKLGKDSRLLFSDKSRAVCLQWERCNNESF